MNIKDVLDVKNDGKTFTIEPDAPIAEAVSRMVEHGIGSLVVMQDGALCGYLTERDIARALHGHGCDLREVSVAAAMQVDPILVTSDDTVDYVREVMTRHHISHLIVMDNDQLTGVISFHDVARACLKDVNFEITLLKRYIRDWPES